jgi:hypothetical protein
MMRPVPDNQEVFVGPHSSVIVELLEDMETAEFHFRVLAEQENAVASESLELPVVGHYPGSAVQGWHKIRSGSGEQKYEMIIGSLSLDQVQATVLITLQGADEDVFKMVYSSLEVHDWGLFA